MNVTMTRISVGIVGVTPGIVLINTDEIDTVVFAAGFLNEAERFSDVQLAPTDFILLSYAPGKQAYCTLSYTGHVITLVDVAGGDIPPVFTSQNVWYVAQNGNNANPGTNPLQPVQTFTQAAALAQATPAAAGVFKLIVCLDSGTYTNSFTISQHNLNISAPSASVANCTLTMAANTNFGASVQGNNIVFGAANNFIYTDTSTTFYNSADEVILTLGACVATTINLGNRSTIYRAAFWDTANCVLNGSSTAANYVINIDDADTANGFSPVNPLITINLASWVNTTGYVGRTSLECGTVIASTLVPMVPNPNYVGNAVFQSSVTDSTWTITTAFDATVPVGWETTVVRVGTSNNVFVVAGAGITLYCSTNNPRTDGPGGYFRIKKLDTNVWWLGGALANGGLTSSNIYFSQLGGSNTTGDGSLSNPYATGSAAITAAGTPSIRTNIVCLDDDTYVETLSIVHPNINIIAPNATLAPTTGTDAIDITNNDADVQISFNQIFTGGVGKPLNVSGSGTVYLSVDSVIGATGAVTTSNANVYIRSSSLTANLTTTGSGHIYAASGTATGVRTGNVQVLTTASVTGPFAIGSLSYTGSDAAAGNLLTTNGSGVLTLQPPAALSLNWQNASSGTQAMAAGAGYTTNNGASIVTFTLPVTAAYGTLIAVMGVSAGGWAVAQNAGQHINFGSMSTTVGVTGSLASMAASDQVFLLCTVANTTWTVFLPSAALSVV